MAAPVASAATEVQGETFVTPAKPVADLIGEATFRWADTHGLTPTQPYTVRVSTAKDAEPRVDLQGLEQEMAILPDEVLKLNFASSDDFGLKAAWVGWTVRSLGEKKDDLGKGEASRTEGGQTKKELAGTAEFTPRFTKSPRTAWSSWRRMRWIICRIASRWNRGCLSMLAIFSSASFERS